MVSQCLQSVVDAGLDGCRLVVVNDAAESGLALWLSQFCNRYDAELLTHEKNLGFVHAANTAFAHAKGRDVLLLNSDTVVHRDWWQRLQTAAHANPQIATVTPLSNNGDICSYPLPPRTLDLNGAFLDDLCQQTNGTAVVDLPTGVGFCLYVRGDCIADVGTFDAEGFGRGYGEENDFCLRASSRGWRHVCHTGVYVEHEGGASFGDERNALMAKADKVLAERYPDYQLKVERFLEEDPLAPYRDALTWARLNDDAQREVVMQEMSAERRHALRRYFGAVHGQRTELAKLHADYTAIADELREANRCLVSDHQSLESNHQTLSANHKALAQELERVRDCFAETESALRDCRTALSESEGQRVVLGEQLQTATNERDYYAAEADRLNALWHMKVGRRIKRLLRL